MTGLTILPSYVINGIRVAPSDRVLMGTIGLERQALSDFSGFKGAVGLQVIACCDTYERYEQLLERKDIDFVEVATPDYWHALATIHACQAGKDVYVLKPLSYTIQEALKMREVALSNKRVVQVGSQQRSSKEFQKAIELVQAGKIGHIDKIYAKVGDPPKPLDLPAQPLPGNLNWNTLNDSKIVFNDIMAPQIPLDPVKNESVWGAWRWYLETGNGYTAAPTAAGLAFEISSPHMQNFVDCVRSREKPIATIEKGCSTAIASCLGNIANELQRPIKWDPATNTFVNDAEASAHRLMNYEYRAPYHL